MSRPLAVGDRVRVTSRTEDVLLDGSYGEIVCMCTRGNSLGAIVEIDGHVRCFCHLESLTRARGFGALSPERRRAVAALGGKRAHANGNAHSWDTAGATIAGRKGGLAVHRAKVRT